MSELSKGMIYTTFALLSSALLLLIAVMPATSSVNINPSESIRIGEASFFLDSVLDDMDRSLSMSTRRSLTASTNYIIENNQPLNEPSENISSALVNGTISGEKLDTMENVSLNEWTVKVSKIADNSGYSLETQLKNHSFSAENFEVKSNYSVFARLKDPVTLASFNRTNTAEVKVSIEDIEDTMILLESKGRYVSKYSKCSFEQPAEKLHTGDYDSNDTAHGEAEVKPADASAVTNPGEKILVVDNADNYADSDINNFNGLVAADNNSIASYSTAWTVDTGSISDVDQNMSLILHKDQVWRSGFRTMFEDNCYLETERGPSFTDRLSNKMISAEGDGLATLVDVSDLPSELRKEKSAVGYVYFNETGSYGTDHKIKGVTDEHSWFRIDQHHVDLWNLNDLTY